MPYTFLRLFRLAGFKAYVYFLQESFLDSLKHLSPTGTSVPNY